MISDVLRGVHPSRRPTLGLRRRNSCRPTSATPCGPPRASGGEETEPVKPVPQEHIDAIRQAVKKAYRPAGMSKMSSSGSGTLAPPTAPPQRRYRIAKGVRPRSYPRHPRPPVSRYHRSLRPSRRDALPKGCREGGLVPARSTPSRVVKGLCLHGTQRNTQASRPKVFPVVDLCKNPRLIS